MFYFKNLPHAIAKGLLLLALAFSLHAPLPAQEASSGPADSLLAAGDSLGAVQWLDSVSRRYVYRDQSKAMIYARQGLAIAERLSDPHQHIRCLLCISEIHFVISDYLPALEFALRAEPIALENQLEEDLGDIYNSIGNVHFMQDDGNKALEYWEKSLDFRRRFNPPGAVAGSLNNIAKELIQQGVFEKAEAYLMEARKINQEIKNWRWEVFNLMNFHELEMAREDFDAAERYAREGLELSESKGYKDGRDFFYIYLAELSVESGDKEEALAFYQKVLDREITPGNREGYLEALSKASELAMEKGRYKDAAELQAEYIHLVDSLHAEDLKGELANIEAANELLAQSREEEYRRQEEELAREGELKQARLMSFIYLLGIGVLLVGAGGLLFSYRQKQRSNRQLSQLVEERTQHLQASNEQLNTFIYKSSHDLYGPVKSLQGLLTLLREVPADSERTVELIGQKVTQLEAELRNLIQTMEIKNSPPNPTELHLNSEVDAAIEAVRNTAGFSSISISNNTPPDIYLTADQWTLGVVLRNLLENAIHFQGDGPASRCVVGVKPLLSSWHIEVRDNGTGVPPAARDKVFDMFFKGSPQSPGSGLGLYNVRLAVEKLGGEVMLVEQEGPGACFRIQLPKQV